MNNIEKRLKNLLSDFVFVNGTNVEISEKSFFGTKVIAAAEFRNKDKALVQSSGIRHFYLSSVMHKNNIHIPSFRYMIVWTMATIRPYRCKSFKDYELDKVFISGRTDEILIENLRREIENGKI